MYRLVLADDSRTIQKVVRHSFPADQLDNFEEGLSALEHVQRWGADVVLADAALPGFDGYELCRRIKLEDRTAAIPVVLLAGSLQPLDEARVASVQPDGVLTKPFETTELVALVERLVKAPPEVRAPEMSVGSPPDPSEQPGDSEPEPPGMLFGLSRSACRSDFQILPVRSWGGATSAAPDLTDEQFRAIIEAVSREVVGSLRQIVPEVARQVLRR